MLVHIGGLSTTMHVGRYSIAKPSTLGRHSAHTLLTLARYSTDTRLSAFFFLYSNCSCLRCPPHRTTYAFSKQDHVYFRHLSVEYRPTQSAATRPKSRSSIDRHYRPTLGRYPGRVILDPVDQYSTDISADTIGQHSAEVSVEY